MSIQVGEVVQLVSGGPRMSVAAVNQDTATCVWFEKNKSFREVFDLIVLRKYQTPGPMVFTL